MADTKTKVNVSGGIGVLGLLGVAFVILKLCKVIGWSWWWVTVPFWGPLALVIAILLVLLSVFGIVLGFAALKRKFARA